jgi:hypothetical protein
MTGLKPCNGALLRRIGNETFLCDGLLVAFKGRFEVHDRPAQKPPW